MTTKKATAPARPRLAGSVLELIGGTPLVRLNRLPQAGGASVLAKMESLNPGGSVKDRIAVAMVEDAERRGVSRPGATLVEPTSGNTGIGLAMVGAVKGYRLILTMPEDMSVERQRLFARFGAEIHLTPAIEGMSGAVFAAEELGREHPEYFMPQQFQNPANPEVHRRTTALEILDAVDGRLDAFVAGVGTGGTDHRRGRGAEGGAGGAGDRGGAGQVAGALGRPLPAPRHPRHRRLVRARRPQSRGPRPDRHGERRGRRAWSERLAREEGVLAGISSGAAALAACRVAAELPAGADRGDHAARYRRALPERHSRRASDGSDRVHSHPVPAGDRQRDRVDVSAPTSCAARRARGARRR